MQTWLPYADYKQSVQCLDDARLIRQKQECEILFDSLWNGSGWINHPAAKMWANYPREFCRYWSVVTVECHRRGFVVNRFPPDYQRMKLAATLPNWLGDEKFHAAHRSNLLRKNPEWYRRFKWQEPETLPYEWPE